MTDLFNRHREGIFYVIFGFIVTLVNWCAYAFSVAIVELSVTLSNAIAWFLAIIVAFITNKIFVFKSKSNKLVELLREIGAFLGSRIFTSLLEIFLPTVLVCIGVNGYFLGIEGFWAKLIVNVIVIVLNYVFSKLFVFKKTTN